MKPTGLARALMAVAGALILAGFLTLTVAPAALGLGLLVYLLHTRRAFSDRVEATRLVVTREIVDHVVHAEEPFQIRLDATDTQLPPDLALTLTDHPPDGIQGRTTPTLAGPFAETFTLQATTKGPYPFDPLQADLADVRGLWQHTTTVPTTTDLRALPPREALETGRRLAKEQPLDATTQKALGTMIRELEFDQLRPYQPGDSLRTLDWKRFARLDEMITKVWEKEGESEVLLLLDAGRTMRAGAGPDAQGRVTKLDHAANLALSIAESAIDHNYPVGMVAFDELRVIDRLPPTRARSLPERLAERLSDLPSQVLARRRLDVGLPGDAPADDQEVDFLETLAALTGDRPTTTQATPGASHRSQDPSGRGTAARRPGAGTRELGLRRAIAQLLQQAGKDKLFVLLFTDLERVPDETLKAVTQLNQRGHRVITAILPGSSFLTPPEPPYRARDLENAYKELETRRRAARLLEARGVTTLELGRESSAADVTASSRQDDQGTRSRGRGLGGVGGRGGSSGSGSGSGGPRGRGGSGGPGPSDGSGGQGGDR